MQTTPPPASRRQPRAAPSNPPTAPRWPRNGSRRRRRRPASATNCAIPSPRSPTAPTPSRRWSPRPSSSAAAASSRWPRTASAHRSRKVDGEWQRGPQRPAAPERPLDPAPARDEVPEPTNVVPMPGAAKAPAQPEQVDAKAIAKIDAQAERTALVARLEAALMDRYIIKRAPVTVGDVTIGRTEYRFRGDTSRVAFTESTFRLATDTNSPSVARSMVDVAEARNWKALRVSGNEDFKRMVWLEASVRGVKTLGYEPNPGDLELLKREREARLVNRIDRGRGTRAGGHGDAQPTRHRAAAAVAARPCWPPSRPCWSPSGAREAARGRDGRRHREAGPAHPRRPGAQGQGLRQGGTVAAARRRADTRGPALRASGPCTGTRTLRTRRMESSAHGLTAPVRGLRDRRPALRDRHRAALPRPSPTPTQPTSARAACAWSKASRCTSPAWRDRMGLHRQAHAQHRQPARARLPVLRTAGRVLRPGAGAGHRRSPKTRPPARRR